MDISYLIAGNGLSFWPKTYIFLHMNSKRAAPSPKLPTMKTPAVCLSSNETCFELLLWKSSSHSRVFSHHLKMF